MTTSTTNDERRRRWREHWKAYARASAEWAARCYEHPAPNFPVMPADLHDLTCGARTRAGTPCKRRDLYASGRCRLHGGLSTGPTSPEGKARVALNGGKRR